MSSYKEKIAQAPIFGALSPALREQVADILLNISAPRALHTGEHLYVEGAIDDNTGAILVDGGLVVAFGTKQPILLQAPEVVGEMQQFNKYGTRTATVCASTNATVLEFSWHDFVARVNDRPNISQADHALLRTAFTKFAGERFKQRQ